MAVVNIMYDVGAKDEDPSRTGFAHLFEHLMFGGSVNIKDYDEPLQMAGGENNAYTTNDLTNYYIQIPAENLETAFWLELIIAAKLLGAVRIKPLLQEASELTAIVVATRKTASSRRQ